MCYHFVAYLGHSFENDVGGEAARGRADGVRRHMAIELSVASQVYVPPGTSSPRHPRAYKPLSHVIRSIPPPPNPLSMSMTRRLIQEAPPKFGVGFLTRPEHAYSLHTSLTTGTPCDLAILATYPSYQ